MLMIDRITESGLNGGDYGKGHVVAELDIDPSLWFFSCHFPGDPVMPGCLGLDAMWQILGFWLGWSGSPGKGRAAGVGEIKFRGQITPQKRRVRYEISMRQVRGGRLVIGVADGSVFADGISVYVARDLRVSLILPAWTPPPLGMDAAEQINRLPELRVFTQYAKGFDNFEQAC